MPKSAKKCQKVQRVQKKSPKESLILSRSVQKSEKHKQMIKSANNYQKQPKKMCKKVAKRAQMCQKVPTIVMNVPIVTNPRLEKEKKYAPKKEFIVSVLLRQEIQ